MRGALGRIAIAASIVACGKSTPAPPPVKVAANVDVGTSAEVVARTFVDKLAAHDFAGAATLVGGPLHTAGAANQLGAAWLGIEAKHGALGSLGAATVGSRTVVLNATFAHDALDLEVAIAGGKVDGFHIATPWREPPYAKPAAFATTHVTVGSAPALPGLLAMPVGAGPFPAVVLVHGSGPNDADETIGRVKVFADLADGLASRGIAVLRYDKRTRVDPRGVTTSKQEVDDGAHAAVALLAATPRVDPARVVVLGHSQGGNLAPRIAADDPKVRGLIVLAGSTRQLGTAIVAQLRYLQTLEPTTPAFAAQITAAQALERAIDDPALAPDRQFPGFGGVTGAYFLADRDYHAPQVAATLDIPIAVLQGERDYQVTPTEDLPAWRAALGSRPKVRFFTYPALGHAFVAGSGPPSPADYMQPDAHVDPKVIDDLATWMQSLPR